MPYIISISGLGESGMTQKYLGMSNLERWIGLRRISLPILRIGFEGEWLTAEEIVYVELARYNSGLPLNYCEEELALLLSDELSRVREILGPGTRNPLSESPPSVAWLYSAGMELLSVWHDIPSPGEDLYEILEQLGLDEEYRDLVYFTPFRAFRRRGSSHYLAEVLRNRLENLRPVVLR